MKATQIINKRLDELIEYEYNPRNNTKAIDPVAESIKEFGFKVPIVCDKNGVIIAGHTRYKASQKLGLREVPCIVADDLSEEQVRAFRLADNKTAELADWDFDLQGIELEGIENIDMSLFGFDMNGIEELPEAYEDEYEQEIPTEPRTKLGDLYQLGNHRVMCGDSSSTEAMDELLGGVLGDMCFTDPPYGVSIGDKNKVLQSVQEAGRITENIMNDTLDTDALYELLCACFVNLREHMKNDASYYVTSPQGGQIGLMMMMMMRDAGLEVRHNLIWKKNSATFSMGRLDYDYQHEPIFYTWTDKHNFYGKGYQTTVWEFDKPRKCDLHPTMKPVELIAHAIENSTRQGDAVVDIFGGSGSTMIACEQMKRACFMMELDPHYVDVIVNRWEEFTGKKAVRVNG